MATTASLRENILINIEAALNNISVDNSYRTNPKLVSRKLKHFDELASDQFPTLFLSDGPETIIDSTNKELMCNMEVIIRGYVKYDEVDISENSASKLLNKLIADVKETLNVDKIRDSNADETLIIAMDTDEGLLEPFAAFELRVSIPYSVDREDMGRKLA